MDNVWENLFSTQEWGKYPPEHVVRFIARNFYREPKRREIKLLEVGCGPGANVWYMAKEGFDVYGIDGSPSAIDAAKERFRNETLPATLTVGDFCALPWPENTFDGVIDNVSLCANRRADVQRAINEVHRVLKPGGKFQSAWFTPDTWGYGLGNEVEPRGFTDITEGPLANRGFCSFVDEADIRTLLRNFSLEAIESVSTSLSNRTRFVSHLIAVARKPN